MVTKVKINGGLGLSSMRQLNTVSLMKLGWRLQTEPNSLWAQVLKNKYCRGSDLVVRKPRGTALTTWRGITENFSLMQRGVSRTIGDGRSTKFWLHSWEDHRPLVELTLSPIPLLDQERWVADHWAPTGGWRWETFRELQPLDTLQKIASFEVFEEGAADAYYWTSEASGRFSIKSAVRINIRITV